MRASRRAGGFLLAVTSFAVGAGPPAHAQAPLSNRPRISCVPGGATPHPGPPPQGGREAFRSPPPLRGRAGVGGGEKCTGTTAECLAPPPASPPETARVASA